MDNIHAIATHPGCCTDKANPDHSFAGQNYLHIYERYFERLRRESFTLLEIGVLYGHSLNLWAEYFPHAEIWGMDVDITKAVPNSDRIHLHRGDQFNPDHLDELVMKAGQFRIVIDDGSHITSHLLASFHHLAPCLDLGGFYCWEDMRITYEPGIDMGWPGMKAMPLSSIKAPHSRKMCSQLFLNLIQDMDFCRGKYRALHFHPMVTVLELL